ncbi:hypothetical protein CQZ93_25915 [Ochrobactrum vermis]|nr:hypothetical protein CQZ93_25915 [Ochrobactrum vermis]
MAAHCLFESWPHKGCREKYWKAVASCLADIDGKPSHLRAAFLATAKKAGLRARRLFTNLFAREVGHSSDSARQRRAPHLLSAGRQVERPVGR